MFGLKIVRNCGHNAQLAHLLWGVCLGRVDWGGENTGIHHLVLWFRNYDYSTLTWKD